jgi:hypothetical protein
MAPKNNAVEVLAGTWTHYGLPFTLFATSHAFNLSWRYADYPLMRFNGAKRVSQSQSGGGSFPGGASCVRHPTGNGQDSLHAG